MQIQGKVIARLEKRTGTSANGNTWESIDFVATYNLNEKYPKNICLTFFGAENVANAIRDLHKDTMATFDFDVEARESKGRWFNSVRCYRYELAGSAPAAVTSAPQHDNIPPQQEDDLPF